MTKVVVVVPVVVEVVVVVGVVVVVVVVVIVVVVVRLVLGLGRGSVGVGILVAWSSQLSEMENVRRCSDWPKSSFGPSSYIFYTSPLSHSSQTLILQNSHLGPLTV